MGFLTNTSEYFLFFAIYFLISPPNPVFFCEVARRKKLRPRILIFLNLAYKFKKPPPNKTYKRVVPRHSIIYQTVLRRVPCGQTPKIQNIEIRLYVKYYRILIGLPKGGYRLIYPCLFHASPKIMLRTSLITRPLVRYSF